MLGCGHFLCDFIKSYIRRPPTKSTYADHTLLEYAIRRSGMTKGRLEDIAFYIAAYRDSELDWRSVRRRGTLIDKEQRKRLNIIYRGHLTYEFLSTLNATGMADPAGAAYSICAITDQLIHSARHLKQSRDSNVELVRFHASNMAAGPCPKAARLSKRRIPINSAELVPFDECTHPDQCACRYQAWLPLMDEFLD